MSNNDCLVHCPAQFLQNADLDGNVAKNIGRFMIILNQPITSLTILSRVWCHATYRICADGGANRLHDTLERIGRSAKHQYLPDVIVGDLDSLRPNVRDFYSSNGVEILHDSSQDNTDLDKSVTRVCQECGSATSKVKSFPLLATKDVFILGGLSGRIDQSFSLLNAIFYYQAIRPDLRLWVFSEVNVSFILTPGRNIIETPREPHLFTKNVGIIPIIGASEISTSGLEWNVQKWLTTMGDNVSTSNHIIADVVMVETTQRVLFTIEIDTISIGEHDKKSESVKFE